MDPRSEIIRLVCVQGTAQLLTAVTALRYHDSQTSTATTYHDVLLVYNLACPADSERGFIHCIEGLAKALHDWAHVVVIRSSDLQAYESSEPAESLAAIQRVLGFDSASAVFMARDCGRGDSLIAAAVQTECRICYGDGIGFYAPAAYLSPKQPPAPFRGYRDWLRRMGSQCARPWAARSTSLFDRGYFVSTTAVGFSPPFPTARVPRTFVLDTYESGAAALPNTIVSELATRLSSCRASCLATTTNSECWGRITEENELEAYRCWMQRAAAGSAFLVKSHPRESLAKVAKVVSTLETLGFDVIFPHPAKYGPYPLELILMALRSRAGVRLERAYAVSAAALALAFLFDCEITIGFGHSVSRKCFAKDYVATQLRQEAAIARSVALLQSDQKRGHPCR